MSQSKQEEYKAKLEQAYKGLASAEKSLMNAELDKREYLQDIRYYEERIIKEEGGLSDIQKQDLRNALELIAQTVSSPSCDLYSIEIDESEVSTSPSETYKYKIISSVELQEYQAKYEYSFTIRTRSMCVLQIIREVFNEKLQKGAMYSKHLEGCGCCNQYSYTVPVMKWSNREY